MAADEAAARLPPNRAVAVAEAARRRPLRARMDARAEAATEAAAAEPPPTRSRTPEAAEAEPDGRGRRADRGRAMRPSRRGRRTRRGAVSRARAREREPRAASPRPPGARSPPRPAGPRGLQLRYRSEVVPALVKQFEYRNPNQVPRLAKIVVNIGLGEALTNAKAIDAASGDLTMITGQKPIVMKARRSIAQFRVRTGNPIGLKVTLRGQRMWDFLERLTMLALPRIRDFRGMPGRSSTAAATTPSGCASRSRSPRSTTTRWTVSAGWRSAS